MSVFSTNINAVVIFNIIFLLYIKLQYDQAACLVLLLSRKRPHQRMMLPIGS